MTEGELRHLMAMREKAVKVINSFHSQYAPQIQSEADRAAREFSKAEPEMLRLSEYLGMTGTVALIDSAVNKARGCK